MTKTRARRRTPNPKKTVIIGRGDYEPADRKQMSQVLSKLDKVDAKIPSISGESIGRSIGKVFGKADAGAKAGGALASLFGFGDYSIKGNSLMAALPAGNAVPVFSKDGRRGVRVTEREYIGDVISGSAGLFTNSVYVLNPASPATFPWLSGIATQFDQWEPHGIVFEFKSTSADYATNQALGTVIMAADYNVYDQPYANKVLMENADYSASVKPSENLMHGIECDPSERPIETLFMSTPTTGDMRFSRLGTFQLATAGCPLANTTLGELWVSYDITFYKKQIGPASGFTLQSASYSAPLINTTTSSIGAAVPLPTNSPDFSVLQLVGIGTRIFFPPTAISGDYLFLWSSNITAGTHTSLSTMSASNAVITNAGYSSQPATTYKAVIRVTGPNAYITVPLSDAGGGATALVITQVRNGVYY